MNRRAANFILTVSETCLQNSTYLAQDVGCLPGALWMRLLSAGSSSRVSVHRAFAACHSCPIGHAHPLQGHGSGALPGILVTSKLLQTLQTSAPDVLRPVNGGINVPHAPLCTCCDGSGGSTDALCGLRRL